MTALRRAIWRCTIGAPEGAVSLTARPSAEELLCHRRAAGDLGGGGGASAVELLRPRKTPGQGNTGVTALSRLRTLDGPRLAAVSGRATALRGAAARLRGEREDLLALAHGWRSRVPDAAFVAPNAPEAVPGMPGALQWFPLTLQDPSEYWRGVVAAAPGLDRFIDQELARSRRRRGAPGARWL